MKTYFHKAMFRIDQKNVLRSTKLIAFCRGHMLLVSLNAWKLLECFTKK